MSGSDNSDNGQVFEMADDDDSDEDSFEQLGGDSEMQDLINGYVSDFVYDFMDRTLYINTVCIFNAPHLSDVTFLVPDEKLPGKPFKPIFAHRLILASCSPVFRQFFDETKSRIITVTGVRFQHFLHIIRYIYVGWVEDTFAICEAGEFMTVVKSLGLENMFQWQVRTWLINAVRQRSDSPVCIYISSIQHKYRDIIRECLCAITDNPKKHFKDPCFGDIPYKGILRLVSILYFNCTDYEIMRAVDYWVKENEHNCNEGQIEALYHMVETSDYRYKGKRYRLQADVGFNMSDLVEQLEIELDQVLDFTVFQPEKMYQFTENFAMFSNEDMFVYGVVVLFGKHRDHDNRFIESHYKGHFSIKFGNLSICNELFEDTIKFNEETFKATEIFFPKIRLNYNHQYKVEIAWRTVGAFPDVLTFEVQSSNFVIDGDCFISELFCDYVDQNRVL